MSVGIACPNSSGIYNRPGEVARYVMLHYYTPDQEILGALFLDTMHHLIADAELFRGAFTRAAVDPRAILKRALEVSAAGLILFHTHPSSNPVPSEADKAFTRRIGPALELVGVRLVDHLVVGNGGRWTSIVLG